jgi:hypothetical protein
MVEASGQGGAKPFSDTKHQQAFLQHLKTFLSNQRINAELRVNVEDWKLLREKFIKFNYLYQFSLNRVAQMHFFYLIIVCCSCFQIYLCQVFIR